MRIVININDGLINLRNNINRKENPGNEYPKEVVDIVENILDFNEKQKSKGIKILTLKQTPLRLTIALAQVKASHTSENLLNEIRQIIYSLYREKEVTKKLYSNIINSIKLYSGIDAIFINSENSKISVPHRLLLNPPDKINLKRSDKYVALPNLISFGLD